MRIEPSSVVSLYYNTGITAGRKYLPKSGNDLTAFFQKHVYTQYQKLTFIRMNTNVIRLEVPIHTVYQCDYLSFKNPATIKNQTIYCRILNCEYVNTETTDITYEIDYWHTYCYNCRYFGIQVHREHLSEADWERAKANPYVDDILELNTPEDDLPADKDLEAITNSTDGTSLFLPSMTVSQMALVMVLGQVNPNETVPGWDTIATQVEGIGGRIITSAFVQEVPAMSTIIMCPASVDAALVIFRDILNALELQGLTGNIMGLYYVPMFYFDTLEAPIYQSQLPNDVCTMSFVYQPSWYQPNSPKLFRFPYFYIRVQDGQGQTKTYQYERFMDLVNGENMVQFRTVFTINGEPTIIFAPYKYDSVPVNDGGTWVERLNFDESITYATIPHIPYSTDGYVTYMGEQHRNNLSQITTGGLISAGLKTAAGAVMTGGGVFLGGSGIPGGFTLGKKGLGMYKENAGNFINDMSTVIGSNHPMGYARHIAGGGNLNPLNLNFSYARKAHAADNLFAGSSKGFAGYMRAPMRFNVQKIHLKSDIFNQYDNYFKVMGYNSGRVGAPRALNYLRGLTGKSDSPHFDLYPGTTTKVTYAKATMQVSGPNKDVADYIEAMFEAGVLFFRED